MIIFVFLFLTRTYGEVSYECLSMMPPGYYNTFTYVCMHKLEDSSFNFLAEKFYTCAKKKDHTISVLVRFKNSKNIMERINVRVKEVARVEHLQHTWQRIELVQNDCGKFLKDLHRLFCTVQMRLVNMHSSCVFSKITKMPSPLRATLHCLDQSRAYFYAKRVRVLKSDDQPLNQAKVDCGDVSIISTQPI